MNSPDHQDHGPSVDATEPLSREYALTPAVGPLPSILVEVRPRDDDTPRRQAPPCVCVGRTSQETHDAESPQ